MLKWHSKHIYSSLFDDFFFILKTEAVFVTVPPTIPGSDTEEERKAIQNRTMILNCFPDGIPTPSIFWMKDGDPVSDISEHMVELNNGRTLEVKNMQVGCGLLCYNASRQVQALD